MSQPGLPFLRGREVPPLTGVIPTANPMWKVGLRRKHPEAILAGERRLIHGLPPTVEPASPVPFRRGRIENASVNRSEIWVSACIGTRGDEKASKRAFGPESQCWVPSGLRLRRRPSRMTAAF